MKQKDLPLKKETISKMFLDSPKLKLKEDKWFHLGELKQNCESGFCVTGEKIDTNTSVREYSERFVWTCCHRIGIYAKGCERI